jgi:hypothetical protein
MKKIGLLLCLCAAMAAYGQQADSSSAEIEGPQGTVPDRVTFPMERVQTPTYADMYCAGFVSKHLVPNANYIAGGLQTPNTTKFVNGDIVYLAGSGYQAGQQYTVVRELRDPNRYEPFTGQHAMLTEMGQPYADLARVRIVDTRSRMAIAQIEFTCDPVDPGDLVIPFHEKAPVSFHAPEHFDRFLPANSKLNGRIVMARDFDTVLGTGAKVYINLGSDQGVKVGDYFRAVRSYEADLQNPVDSLSFKATVSEDTQKEEPSIEPHLFTGTKGPVIHVADLPRRAVGEVVILSTTPTTATGMVVFALEDVHVGDRVELDNQ